jgi:hypothetical protein
MCERWMLVLLILEDFEDTKGVIRIHKLNTERKHFSQKKKDKKDKKRSTKHAHKTKDRVTRTPLKSGMNSSTPEEMVEDHC